VRPDFRYDARVMTALPQVVSAGFTWQATEWLRWVGQVEWADWSNAFDRLDITLTGGNNADLNGFLGTDRIDDTVPLRWKDTWVFRTGFEVPVSDAIRLRAGYAFGESPVPAETMTPMSAAILEHLVTAGAEWTRDRWSIGLAYQYGFESSQGVGASDLRSGEFTGSSTRLEFHGFGLTTTYRY
jgi:long-chain fatty acid transport protein